MRVYFGSEFCEYLIPSKRELINAHEKSLSDGFDFTFVTPPVTDTGVEKLQVLFEYLDSVEMEIEVVANDWGVVTLASRFEFLQPVMGRLLNKMLREPRFNTMYKNSEVPKAPLKIFQNSGISSNFMEIIKRYRIKRIELDNLYQGFGEDLNLHGLDASVYLPYGYIASGRMCYYAAVGRPTEVRFLYGRECQKQCIGNSATMVSEKTADLNNIIQKGNTVFYKQDKTMIDKALQWIKNNRARVVIFEDPIELPAKAFENIEDAEACLSRTFENQRNIFSKSYEN
ncbi:MAG: hypothetical protein ABUK01_15915 [Leptospirales bacterium]